MGDQQWVIDLQSELESINLEAELKRKKKRCVFRVPKRMRDLNEDAYAPRFFSIGPYHHGEAHLKPMESCKRLALAHYLERAGKMTLAQVVEALRPEVQEMMDSYDGLEEPWTNEERFLELMILDGCFLLDILTCDSMHLNVRHAFSEQFADMLMLENQLPMLVLAALIVIGGDKIEEPLAFWVYYWTSFRNQTESETIGRRGIRQRIVEAGDRRSLLGHIVEENHHILDLYKKTHTHQGDYLHNVNWTIHPATELVQAGVSFKRSESDCFQDISFSNGILKLPLFVFNSDGKTKLLNYLAYEEVTVQQRQDLLPTYRPVTCYAFLMDSLVNTAKDVALLREKGIIECRTGSDDEIATFFNKCTGELTPIDSRPWDGGVNRDLNVYCNKRWHKWRAIFMQTYLSNPWVFISLVVALILLGLTVSQTLYTIMPYYGKP